VLGGFQAGEGAVAAIAIVALALGFLGLLHALLEGVFGGPGKPRRSRSHRAERRVVALTGTLASALLALTGAGLLLPGSALVEGLL
jgi:hydrogenase-4 component F